MFKKFLRNLFSLRTVNVITRTCICILSVLVTLAVIEIGFFSNEERGYRARLGRFMPETEEENKEDKSLSVDTLQGSLFPFKHYWVLPLIERKETTHGKSDTYLNFKMFDRLTNTDTMLFSRNQRISESKFVQVRQTLLWLIETPDTFFVYNNQSDRLLAVAYPDNGYRLLYPEDLSGLHPKEFQEKKTAHIEKKEVYVVEDNYCSPFAIWGNQVLIIAKDMESENKCYWVYDVENQEIELLGS